MKKFVFIYTGSSAKGGLSTYYRNLFENYPTDSNKIILASFGTWAMPAELQKEGHDVVTFPKSIRGVIQFSRYLRNEKIDLVVTGGVLSNFIGRLIAGTVPVVTVIHSLFKTDYPRALKRVIWDFINTLYKKRTIKYIAVSEFLKQNLISAGIKPEKITVIYNGIEPMTAIKAKEHKSFNIVSVGRLHRTKGFDRLVHVARFLPENYQIQIWGEGAERENLQYLIESNNLSGKVQLCGASKDIRSALAGANLYVQASRMEGFGLATAEAMMLEVPVAVTPVGGLPEVVERGKAGLLFNSADPKEMAEQILEISQNKIALQELAVAGRASAEKRFDAKKWAKSMDDYLSEVVK